MDLHAVEAGPLGSLCRFGEVLGEGLEILNCGFVDSGAALASGGGHEPHFFETEVEGAIDT
jgi:hypothetical protein